MDYLENDGEWVDFDPKYMESRYGLTLLHLLSDLEP
jgi:hypothetical protein